MAVLLRKARDEYSAVLKPIEVQSYYPAKDDRESNKASFGLDLEHSER